MPIQSFEEDEEEDDADENGLVTRLTRDGLPRKRVGRPPTLGRGSDKRKITRLGRTGGFFRDYRPAPGDEEGADIRGVGGGGGLVDWTPGTWVELLGKEGSGSGGGRLESIGDGGEEGSRSGRMGIEDVEEESVDQDGLPEGQDDDADVAMEDVGGLSI